MEINDASQRQQGQQLVRILSAKSTPYEVTPEDVLVISREYLLRVHLVDFPGLKRTCGSFLSLASFIVKRKQQTLQEWVEEL